MRRNAASSPRYRFNYWWKEVWTTVGSLDAKNNENHLRGRKLVNIFIFFFQRLIHQFRRNRDSFRTLLMNHNTFNFQSSEIHVSTNSPTTSPPLFLIPLKIRLREIKGAKFSINFRQRSSKFGEEKKELIRATGAMESCQSSGARIVASTSSCFAADDLQRIRDYGL